MPQSKPQGFIFDLDGTLIDSVAGLAHACQAMCDQLNLPQPSEEQVRHWVGNGAERLIKRALTQSMDGEPEADLLEKAKALFLEAYEKCCADHAEPYEYVNDALAELHSQQIPMALATNKPIKFTMQILVHLGWVEYFTHVSGGDNYAKKKPDPYPLEQVAKHWNVDANNLAMVGDSENDVKAGRSAGMTTICVPYGYNHGQPIEDAAPDYIIKDFSQLKQFITS